MTIKSVKKPTQPDVPHEQRLAELRAFASQEPAAKCPSCDGWGIDSSCFICADCDGTGNQPEEYFHEHP